MVDKKVICTCNEKYSTHSFSKSQLSFNAIVAYQARITEKFCKSCGQNRSNGFKFLFQKFPKLSQAMIKEKNFVVSHISVVLKDHPECEKALNTLERQAWNLNRFAQIFWEISSHLYIKKVLQSCLRHTKRWDVACL